MGRRRTAWFAALLLSMGAAAQAQQARVFREGRFWVEETAGTLPAARVVRVETDAGAVHVQGGSGGVSYVVRKRVIADDEEAARRLFGMLGVEVATRGDAAVLESGRGAGHVHLRGTTDFTVTAPRQTGLVRVGTHAGEVTVHGIDGRVVAESGGGPVDLDDIGGDVSATTGGDNIHMGRVAGAAVLETGGGNVQVDSGGRSVRVETAGGNVVVLASRGDVSVETGGGNVRVQQAGGSLHASTGGGVIEVGDIAGAVLLETGGGSIRLASSRGPVQAETSAGAIQCYQLARGLHAETGAGGITAEFVAAQNFADSRLETSMGDIVVYLPPDLKATVRASIEFSNGHTISSEFGTLKVNADTGRFGPGEVVAEGALNGGGPVLALQTTTGSIQIRKTRH